MLPGAAFFPSITLTSSIGTLSTDMSNLFKGGRGTWSFAPAISLPIFTGGANEANLEAAKIYQKEQVAAYEKAIQTAFREVNDALSTESTITKRVEAQDEMVKAAEAAYDVAGSPAISTAWITSLRCSTRSARCSPRSRLRFPPASPALSAL